MKIVLENNFCMFQTFLKNKKINYEDLDMNVTKKIIFILKIISFGDGLVKFN